MVFGLKKYLRGWAATMLVAGVALAGGVIVGGSAPSARVSAAVEPPMVPASFSQLAEEVGPAVVNMRETIAMLKGGLGHDPETFGLASNFDPRTRFARSFLEKLAGLFGGNLLDSAIPSTVKFREAAAVGVSILEHAPLSRGAESFLRLAGEVLRKNAKRR